MSSHSLENFQRMNGEKNDPYQLFDNQSDDIDQNQINEDFPEEGNVDDSDEFENEEEEVVSKHSTLKEEEVEADDEYAFDDDILAQFQRLQEEAVNQENYEGAYDAQHLLELQNHFSFSQNFDIKHFNSILN
mmetsp:Transcript_14763/g.10665  ORF Transcript_14763/g.10665 Transcript_14763/m.10665 type:complete len:132 (-) Transcript_14763:1309-1704(-)